MVKIAERLKQVRPSGIRRMFDLAQGVPGVISLGIGQPDYIPPKHVIEAYKKALDEGYCGYSPSAGYLELRKAVAERYENKYGLKYDPETEVCITAGGSEALYDIIQAYINPGDEVLTPDPGFLYYDRDIYLAGGKPVYIRLREENEFKMDPDEVAEKITPKTKMIIINFPSNPTGSVMTRNELKAICEIVEDHDIILVSDEVYEEFVYDGHKHVCLAEIAPKEKTIIVNALSKTYAATGFRIAFLVTDKELMLPILRIHQYLTANANSPAQIAAIAALRGPQDQVKEMIAEFDARRKIIVNGLKRIKGFRVVEPKGAFYVFPNIKAFGMTGKEFSEFLLKETKVAVVPGDEFGPSGEYYVRISYATSREKLKEALARMEDALEKIEIKE